MAHGHGGGSSSGGKIGALLFMVVILGAAVYVYNSGILSSGSAAISQLFGTSSSSTTATSSISRASTSTAAGTSTGGFFSFFSLFSPKPGSLPNIPAPGTDGSGVSGGTTIAPASSGGSSAPSSPPAVDPSQIPPGYTAAQLSPYFHQLHVSGSSGNGQITINTSLDQGKTVDVTGWEIKTNRGGEFVPQAVLFYNPIGTGVLSDIILKPGDYVNIFANSSPVNLRLNKCIGYLNNTNQFQPQFPESCPSINQSEVQGFTGACQNYIFSIGGCQTANTGDPRIPQNDPSCVDYIENHFTYNSCFSDHESDADFFSNEVRVWAGGNPLDQFHDRVFLLDKRGLIVDYFNY